MANAPFDPYAYQNISSDHVKCGTTKLSYAPQVLAFQRIAPGEFSDMQEFTITNPSNRSMQVTSVSIALPFFLSGDTSFRLAPGESKTMGVYFLPGETGLFTGDVRVSVDNGELTDVIDLAGVCDMAPGEGGGWTPPYSVRVPTIFSAFHLGNVFANEILMLQVFGYETYFPAGFSNCQIRCQRPPLTPWSAVLEWVGFENDDATMGEVVTPLATITVGTNGRSSVVQAGMVQEGLLRQFGADRVIRLKAPAVADPQISGISIAIPGTYSFLSSQMFPVGN